MVPLSKSTRGGRVLGLGSVVFTPFSTCFKLGVRVLGLGATVFLAGSMVLSAAMN